MKFRTNHSLSLSLSVSLLLAGGSVATAAPDAAAKPATPPVAGAAAEPGKLVGPPEVAWKDLTKDQKGRFMKEMVTPKMKVVFQEFDAREFKKFDCAVCHSKEAKARKFKMPNSDIAALPDTPEAFQAMMAKKKSWPKWAKFMSERVVPEMATLLGVPAFDHKKPEAGGLSCTACHTLIKSK